MFVLDESSYRLEKNAFETEEEAKQFATEAARILGRPITVYQLVAQELMFAFRVLPDGSTDMTDLSDVESGETVEPATQVVKGMVTASASMDDRDLFDAIAETLERAGRADLAAQVDREAEEEEANAKPDGPEKAIERVARRLTAGSFGYGTGWGISPEHLRQLPEGKRIDVLSYNLAMAAHLAMMKALFGSDRVQVGGIDFGSAIDKPKLKKMIKRALDQMDT